MLSYSGLPSAMGVEDLHFNASGARGAHADEAQRTRAGFSGSSDPAFLSSGSAGGGRIEDKDISSLRKKFKFLEEFSDNFIRSTPYEALLKTETTAIKISEFERGKAVTLRLSNNRDKLGSCFSAVPAGKDNRWDELHEARFLPGAGCPAAKLWLRARAVMGDSCPDPISTYDMNSIGLGGYVSKRGWVEIHNVGSDSLSLKLFNINGCGNKISSGSCEEEFKEIAELGEFKLALRVAREALSFVHPWNKSIAAIEGFLIQSNFCSSDLSGVDKSASVLTQFVDYIFGENADRWRAQEPFLNTGDLRSSWASFFGAKPVSTLQKAKQAGQNSAGKGKGQQSSSSSSKPSFFKFPGYFDDICRMYNMGRCAKPAGSCATTTGVPLRHICNYRQDMSKPANVCGKDHPCCLNH